MDYKKIGKALLFPHIAILMILLPVSAVFLVYSMIFLGTSSVAARRELDYVVSYLLFTIYLRFY